MDRKIREWHAGVALGQTRDEHGELLIGGIAARTLAEQYGTPLVVMNLDVVDAAIGEFEHFHRFDVDVSYAAKAFITVAFARHLASRSIGLDVCSMGELTTAERAGFLPQRITLHGAGKSDDELIAGCRGRARTIVVDGIEELRRLSEVGEGECSAGVLLRLNVGIEPQTHRAVRTAGGDTKFGIDRHDEDAAVAMLSANPHLRFSGLHAHIGSQVFDAEHYLACTDALLNAAARFARSGLPSNQIVIGGGFAVQTHPDVPPPSLDVAATVGAARRHLTDGAAQRGLPTPRLGIEPGRAIVARAGTTIYRVQAVKRQTDRTFVIVDGGIAENPRPALYGARHLVIPVRAAHDHDMEVTLCGRSCENDELAVARLPSTTCSGDLLAMHATGAYTYSMAGNYNRFARPAVVAVCSGSHQLLARRESVDDVLRLDM